MTGLTGTILPTSGPDQKELTRATFSAAIASNAQILVERRLLTLSVGGHMSSTVSKHGAAAVLALVVLIAGGSMSSSRAVADNRDDHSKDRVHTSRSDRSQGQNRTWSQHQAPTQDR